MGFLQEKKEREKVIRKMNVTERRNKGKKFETRGKIEKGQQK